MWRQQTTAAESKLLHSTSSGTPLFFVAYTSSDSRRCDMVRALRSGQPLEAEEPRRAANCCVIRFSSHCTHCKSHTAITATQRSCDKLATQHPIELRCPQTRETRAATSMRRDRSFCVAKISGKPLLTRRTTAATRELDLAVILGCATSRSFWAVRCLKSISRGHARSAWAKPKRHASTACL